MPMPSFGAGVDTIMQQRGKLLSPRLTLGYFSGKRNGLKEEHLNYLPKREKGNTGASSIHPEMTNGFLEIKTLEHIC